MAYGKRGMLADIREGLGHGGNIYGLGAVPVKEVILHGEPGVACQYMYPSCEEI